MNDLPSCFQVRKDCIISYVDYSSVARYSGEKTIVSSGMYSQSAKKRFEKYLKLWSYSIDGTEMKFSFITLTLSSKMDPKINYTLLLKYLLEKLQYRYGLFNYCWKIEFQKNGNLHFHMIVDTEIDWKIVRKQWNKLQSNHVDDYQIKMINKYKNGYYYDEKMLGKNNEIVNEETQQKRYYNGVKANWRNPNSTDVKVVDCINGIDGYVSKYVAKSEDENNSNIPEHSIKRFYGLSDSIRLLKYCTINEIDINNEDIKLLQENNYKEIKDDKGRYLCTIIKKINSDYIKARESEVKKQNLLVLNIHTIKTKNKLVQKELRLYDKLYN